MNWANEGDPAACMDGHFELLGAAAVEGVVALIHRNEFGLSEHPRVTLIPGGWRTGPTLR